MLSTQLGVYYRGIIVYGALCCWLINRVEVVSLVT